MKYIIALCVIVIWAFYLMPFTADIMDIEGMARVIYAGATSVLVGSLTGHITRDM